MSSILDQLQYVASNSALLQCLLIEARLEASAVTCVDAFEQFDLRLRQLFEWGHVEFLN